MKLAEFSIWPCNMWSKIWMDCVYWTDSAACLSITMGKNTYPHPKRSNYHVNSNSIWYIQTAAASCATGSDKKRFSSGNTIANLKYSKILLVSTYFLIFPQSPRPQTRKELRLSVVQLLSVNRLGTNPAASPLGDRWAGPHNVPKSWVNIKLFFGGQSIIMPQARKTLGFAKQWRLVIILLMKNV